LVNVARNEPRASVDRKIVQAHAALIGWSGRHPWSTRSGLARFVIDNSLLLLARTA
jgi:hypothetical protein